MSGIERIKFADDLVPAVLDGEKTATVRVDGPPLRVGQEVAATTESGSEFATLEIMRTAGVLSIEAYSFIEMVGASHGAHGTDDLLERLQGYYESVKPGTAVDVYVFRVVDND